MAVVLLLAGAILATVGAGLVWSWPASVLVAGLLMLAAGVDLARTPRPMP